MTGDRELGTVTSAVSMVTPLVVVNASGSPSLLVKLLATALTPEKAASNRNRWRRQERPPQQKIKNSFFNPSRQRNLRRM